MKESITVYSRPVGNTGFLPEAIQNQKINNLSN